MTVIVTIKVNDGIVLAADSAATFTLPGQVGYKIYNNANKIFNLVSAKPVGALVYGTGGIGSSSVETLSKDLRSLFQNANVGDQYHIDESTYTIEQISNLAKSYLFDNHYNAAYPQGMPGFAMGYRVCGYSASTVLPEVWEFQIVNNACSQPAIIQSQGEFGIRWQGEREALDRLLLGATQDKLRDILISRGILAADATDILFELVRAAGVVVVIPAMPIQDAIDVGRFLVDVAAKFARYGLRAETVGGPIEIAAITKHEGFKWVERKHYYPATLNRETDHV